MKHSKSIRVECRIGGADLNPYLAIAALIAAGIKGIEDKMELEPPFVGDAYVTEKLREIPKTLREATQTLKARPCSRRRSAKTSSAITCILPNGSSSNMIGG